MKPLFIVGCGRSGTTGLTRYLNQHESVLVCIERYKYIPGEITPDLFTFDRILDYREGETNIPRERHVSLVESKDPVKLEWVGDKTPNYVKNLEALHKNNPEARFIVLYRPVEEVAESYDARSKDPSDAWLEGKNGFEIGVQEWNVALRKTREFIESDLNPSVLIVNYHDFFQGNESCISQLSRFLELEFGGSTRDTWEGMSRSFENNRRPKNLASEEQLSFLRRNKDRVAEDWVLDRIGRQQDMSWPAAAGISTRSAQQDRIEALEGRFTKERQKTRRLQERNQRSTTRVQRLEGQLLEIRNLNSWKVVRAINSARARVSSKATALLQKRVHWK